MTFLVSFAAAFFMALSGFFFDSDFTKSSPIPYPIFHLGLGFLCIILFLEAKRWRLSFNREVSIVGFLFFVIYIIGLVASLLSGAGNVLALGMKTGTLFLNFAFLSIAGQILGARFYSGFSKSFLTLSVCMALIVPFFFREKFNMNWGAITLLFAYIFYCFSNENIKKMYLALGFLLIGIYSYSVFSARGVSIACFISVFYLFVSYLFPGRIKSYTNGAIYLFMPLIGVAVSLFGVWLYRSPYYVELTIMSREETGKSLDSSRLERWDLGYRLFQDHPFIGWGVDAHISRASYAYDYGDLHNLWWEYLFRFGLFGSLLLLCVFFYISYKLSKKVSDLAICTYLIAFVFLSVYALGGVTHWPGAFMFWFAIGLLLKKNGASSKYSKGVL